MKTENNHLKKLIEKGENQQLDFKFEISDAAKIARTLVAFANTDGGKLLIGVKDNGVIKGVESDEEYYMVENAAHRFCRPEVKFNSKEWTVNAKKVLEIDIPKSSNLPHRAPDHSGRHRAYIRVKDENILANGVIMKYWKNLTSGKKVRFTYSKTVQKLLTYMRQNQYVSMKEIIRETGLSKYKAEQLLADLIQLYIVDINMNAKSASYSIKDIPIELQ